MKPICHLSDLNVNQVSELVDAQTGGWDEELTRQVLIAPDVYVVLAMLRPGYGGEDFWACSAKKSSTYSV